MPNDPAAGKLLSRSVAAAHVCVRPMRGWRAGRRKFFWLVPYGTRAPHGAPIAAIFAQHTGPRFRLGFTPGYQ
jgi:hypothetical protein